MKSSTSEVVHQQPLARLGAYAFVWGLDHTLRSLIVRLCKNGNDRRNRVVVLPHSLTVEPHAQVVRSPLVGAADIEAGHPVLRSHMQSNGSNRGPVCHGLVLSLSLRPSLDRYRRQHSSEPQPSQDVPPCLRVGVWLGQQPAATSVPYKCCSGTPTLQPS